MSIRPLRNTQEKITGSIPEVGPVGNGQLIGVAGFAGVTFANTISPLPVGFDIQESRAVSTGGEIEKFEYKIWAISRDVATFVARKEAAGSNLNLLTDDTKVTRADKLRERSTHTLWDVNVQVDRDDEVDPSEISEITV